MNSDMYDYLIKIRRRLRSALENVPKDVYGVDG